MKIVDLFTHLRNCEADKKISDPIKNVVSAYQKAFDNDDIGLMLYRYDDVYERFKEIYDNNTFTLRNYMTAYRDLCRMSVVKESFEKTYQIETDEADSHHGSTEDAWDTLVGKIERSRTEYVRDANAIQRQKKKEIQKNQSIVIESDTKQDNVSSNETSAKRIKENKDDESESHEERIDAGHLSPTQYQEQIDILQNLLNDKERELIINEQKWNNAMQCISSVIDLAKRRDS